MQIKKVVLHDLNIRNQEDIEDIISTDTFQQIDSPKIQQILIDHIKKVQSSNRTIPARFNFVAGAPDQHVVLRKVRNMFTLNDANILEVSDNFINKTIELTKSIRNKMQNKSRSDGLVLFIWFTDDDLTSEKLAILKIDLTDGIQYNVEELGLTNIEMLLPGQGSKIQKGVIIDIADDNSTSENLLNDPKMKVIDAQNGAESKYFFDLFLNAIRLTTIKGVTQHIADTYPKYLSSKGIIENENEIDVRKKIIHLMETSTNKQMNLGDVFDYIHEYFTEDYKNYDREDFEQNIATDYLTNSVLTKYSNATMILDVDPKSLRRAKYNNSKVTLYVEDRVSENVEIKNADELDTNELRDDVTVILLKNGLGEGLA